MSQKLTDRVIILLLWVDYWEGQTNGPRKNMAGKKKAADQTMDREEKGERETQASNECQWGGWYWAGREKGKRLISLLLSWQLCNREPQKTWKSPGKTSECDRGVDRLKHLKIIWIWERQMAQIKRKTCWVSRKLQKKKKAIKDIFFKNRSIIIVHVLALWWTISVIVHQHWYSLSLNNASLNLMGPLIRWLRSINTSYSSTWSALGWIMDTQGQL